MFTVTRQPASSLDSLDSTTFIVQAKLTSSGAKSAIISIASNDANEKPFDIALTGTGITAPEIALSIVAQIVALAVGNGYDGVEALADALEGIGRDHSPLDWARAQAMLGTGLQIMGEASTSERAYEKAVSCFDRAGLVLQKQPALSLNAHIAGARAVCLARCAELTGDLAVLDAAEAAFRAELTNRSASADPVAWAICQTNLARLYEARADLTGKDNGQRAAAAFRSAVTANGGAVSGVETYARGNTSVLSAARRLKGWGVWCDMSGS